MRQGAAAARRTRGDPALVLSVFASYLQPTFCCRICDAADLGGWGDGYQCPTKLSPLSSCLRWGIAQEELEERFYLCFLFFLGSYIHLLGCRRHSRSVPWVEQS